MLTTTLRNGLVVMAKMYRGDVVALTYANRAQANRAAEKISGTIHGTRPFYVCPKACARCLEYVPLHADQSVCVECERIIRDEQAADREWLGGQRREILDFGGSHGPENLSHYRQVSR